MTQALVKTPAKILLAVFCLLFLAFTAQAQAATTRPTFKVVGGADIFVGGGFSGGSCNSNYQSGATGGGILSFAIYNGNTSVGSGSEYGAFALGTVGGPVSGNTEPFGFASYMIGNGNNKLTFANSGVTGWGGSFQGSASTKHCIEDYYNTEQTNPVDVPSGGITASGQYKATANGASYNVNSAISSIGPNQNIALFVNGNAYIGSPITYAGGYDANSIPKFVLVAKGDIYIAPSVARLDGWYIAQASTVSQGVFWTCHSAGATVPDDTYIKNCTTALTVNGAITAEQIKLLRVASDGGAVSNVAAETINYTPEMALGQSFFNDQASGGNFSIDSVSSLPPIY